MRQAWTVRRVLGWTTQHFDRHRVDAPRLASEVLLGHVLGKSRVHLYTDLDRPLDQEELAAYRALISRRVEGEPLQYLTGQREFYGRPFQVDSRVLIPRPETELLVERGLELVPRADPHPDAERYRPDGRQELGDHAQAARKDGPAHGRLGCAE